MENIENENSLNESLESIMGLDSSVEDKLAKTEEANKKLFARAKAAEEELKAVKKQNPQQPAETPNNPLNRDEIILLAQGTSPKELELLQKISKLENISLLEAKDNDLFKTYQMKLEQEKRSEQSRLGASKGSGSVESKSTVGMSREEHQALFKEKMGL